MVERGEQKKKVFVHGLNGTGSYMNRVLVCVDIATHWLYSLVHRTRGDDQVGPRIVATQKYANPEEGGLKE